MNKLTLEHLYLNHKGKLSDKWSLYLGEYDRIFKEFQEKPINILEIGIQNGGSLEIWARYFDKANKIIGCDIDSKCLGLTYEDYRISVIVGDATQDATALQIKEIAATFDIVIEDGSHRSGDIVKAFSKYFSYVVDGGLFIAEDLHASYWSDFEGGLFDPLSSMSFFKILADLVNHEHWRCEMHSTDLLIDFSERYGISFDVDQ